VVVGVAVVVVVGVAVVVVVGVAVVVVVGVAVVVVAGVALEVTDVVVLASVVVGAVCAKAAPADNRAVASALRMMAGLVILVLFMCSPEG